MAWSGLIHAYGRYLPLKDPSRVVTLMEGNTPLLPAPKLARAIRLDGSLFLKFDGQNPTGSFKDRGMTYAVSKALAQGAQAIICASTGNTAASAAAYAARAGLKCFVVVPDGHVALGKLSQAVMHGAQVVQIQGNFDRALELVREISQTKPVTLVNSVNPFRIEGQKTAAFEICDALNRAPDFHALPVGNAGNITAYWKGYNEYMDNGQVKNLPRMLGFQAAGAAPIVKGQIIQNPETIATAIRVGNPASWKSAERARDESGGLIEAVTDDEILESYDLTARLEGVFCEPACAAAVAGVKKMAAEGLFGRNSTVVCTLTGHGLKDPQTALSRPVTLLKAGGDLQDVLGVLGF